MVTRWQMYDEHAEENREYQEERKAEAKQDKESRIKQRENNSKFIKQRQEGELDYYNSYNYRWCRTDTTRFTVKIYYLQIAID